MRRAVFGWHSPRLGMEMPIARYGHWGPALLLIPTWKADFLEAEQRGLIDALRPWLDAGRLTVFSVNTITPWAWCADDVPMPLKARRSAAFSAYLDEEVVPHVRRELRSPDARLAIGGASLGAFFAADAVCRRPDLYGTLVGLSGVYELGDSLRGYADENVYFHSPTWYLPGLPEGPTLHRLRTDTRLHLLTGRGAWEEPWHTEHFAGVLRARGIPVALDVWGEDAPHDWPTWHRMAQVVAGRLGW